MAKAAEMLGGRDPSFGVAPVIRTILSMVRFPPVLVMSRPARWMMLEIREASNSYEARAYLPTPCRTTLLPPPPFGKNRQQQQQTYPDALGELCYDEAGGGGGGEGAATPSMLGGSRVVCRGGLSADRVS